MVDMIRNDLANCWAVPDHPITCANPAPWKIYQMQIEAADPIKILIRGEGSMWFNLNDCFVSTHKPDLEDLATDEALRKRAFENHPARRQASRIKDLEGLISVAPWKNMPEYLAEWLRRRDELLKQTA